MSGSECRRREYFGKDERVGRVLSGLGQKDLDRIVFGDEVARGDLVQLGQIVLPFDTRRGHEAQGGAGFQR